MKKFFKDRKNIALTVCIAIIYILFMVIIGLMRGGGGGKKIMRVDNIVVTDQQILHEMQRQVGDQVVMKMLLDGLLESYGTQKNIKVNESEIEQFVNFEKLQLALDGKTLEDDLAEKNTTLNDYKRDLAKQVLQVKLVVPEKDIRAQIDALAKAGTVPYTLPRRYRIREFFFMNAKDAKKAYDLLQKPEGLKDAVRLAANAADAEKVRLYAPEFALGRDGKPQDPEKNKVLATLKAGQCSQPFAIGANKEYRRIVQVVEAFPPEPPTFENRGMIVGMKMLNTEKYAVEARKMIADAVMKTDVRFYTDDYKRVREQYNEIRKRNPEVNMGNPGGMPGGGGMPSMPAPPPGGAGTAGPK